MKIESLTPDVDGRFRTKYAVRFLGGRLVNNEPTLWVVTDPVGKKGKQVFTAIAKENGESIDPALVVNYVTTLANDHVAFHIFEEISKIVTVEN